MSLSLQSVTPSYIPCDPKNFLPSLPAAKAILEAGPQQVDGREVFPRAIVLVTPNNPTGARYTPEALKEWYDLARKHDIPLVLDETYRDFTGTKPPHGLFADPNWRETLITMGSFSSECCIA